MREFHAQVPWEGAAVTCYQGKETGTVGRVKGQCKARVGVMQNWKKPNDLKVARLCSIRSLTSSEVPGALHKTCPLSHLLVTC